MSRRNRRAHAAILRKVKPYTRKLAEWVKAGTKAYPDPVDAAHAYERAGFGPPPCTYEQFAALIAPSRPQNQPKAPIGNEPPPVSVGQGPITGGGTS